MRLKDLFTVPKGEKVTEKYLFRALTASICSILLCMSCLVSATWAWFVVSVENPGNEIAIAIPELYVSVAESQFVHASSPYTQGTELSYKSAKMRIFNVNNEDDLNKKTTLYATFTLKCEGEMTVFYIVLNEENDYWLNLDLQNDAGKTFSISWLESWFEPVGVKLLTGDTIVLNKDGTANITTPQATEPSQEPSTETTGDASETTGSAVDPAESGDENA